LAVTAFYPFGPDSISGQDKERPTTVPTQIPSVATFTAPGVQAPVDPAKNPTRAAAYWLGRDIARGVFLPGERLKVEQLTKFYDVGHSPIREAILLLSAGGLVVHEHQKGHRVAPVSLADYDDVLLVYQRLHRMILDMAMERGDEAWEERVVVQLHRSAKVQKVLNDGSESRELWQRAYGDFHQTLLWGCGSPLLMKIYSDIGARLERYVNLFADLESDRHRDHHAEHRQIVDALVERDADRVHKLVDHYFAVARPIRDSIIETLKRKEAGGRRGTTADGPPRRRGRPPKAAA
jgi:GntR family carbon starvation induced transcriptional regulator